MSAKPYFVSAKLIDPNLTQITMCLFDLFGLFVSISTTGFTVVPGFFRKPESFRKPLHRIFTNRFLNMEIVLGHIYVGMADDGLDGGNIHS